MTGKESPSLAPHNLRFYAPLALAFLGGAVFIALAEILDVPRGVKDGTLILGGALIGLMSLGVDELLRGSERRASEQELTETRAILAKREEREALLARDESSNAFYFGWAASLVTVAESVDEPLGRAVRCCDNLHLGFSESEQQVLNAASRDFEWREEMSAILLGKGESLGPRVRAFFQLGNTVAWLSNQLGHWYRTHAVVSQLSRFAKDPFIELDASYLDIVGDLVDTLEPYREAVADGDREALKARVLEILDMIPPLQQLTYDTRVPDPSSEWIWANDDESLRPVRMLGRYTITALGPTHYEVEREDVGKPVKVTRDGAGWHCAEHADASFQEPCGDLEVVLDATSGGNPVTQARLVLIRTE